MSRRVAGVPRFIILRHPEGIAPGTLFPLEYEGEWFDREECGAWARVVVIHPATLCFPVGIKFRRKSDGAIADVYEPRIHPSLKDKLNAEAVDRAP